MKLVRKGLFLFALTALAAIGVSAQETQTRVIDEVVAQVNESVITLSRVKRESKNIVETYIEEGKPRAEAQKMVDERQGELIAGLINEELLIQRAKELGLDSEIDSLVNQKFVEIMKENKITTIEALYREMEKNGVNPTELRENWRKQATRDRVIQREVQSRIYWEASGKDLQAYFEKNKAKFTKPERISFSELFLAFAGRDEAAVREKAKTLHTQLKGGADFAKLTKDEGDPGLISRGEGKIVRAAIEDLVDVIATPLKGLKIGDITVPIEIEQLGIVILKVDEREAASSESEFDENAVRMAILSERGPEEQKKFMAKLRNDAYIKINDTYRPLVSPVLFADERKETPGK